MALEGKEITTLTDSELKTVQDALKITDINSYLKDHGLKDNSTVGAKEFFNSSDFNEYDETGAFKIGSSLSEYTHAPEGAGGYGVLFVFRAVNVIGQLYITRDNPHAFYYRAIANNSGTDTQYTWNKIADTSHLKGKALTVSGASTLNGDLTVNGNITQNGSAYETHAEQVKTKKDYIIMREGATTALADGAYTGIEAVKYDGTNNGRLVFDKDGTARVGDVGDEQPLATRAEDSAMSNGKFVKWNGTTKRIETSSDSIATINDSSVSSASAYSSQKTNNQIDNYTRLFATCETEATTQAKTATISGVSSSYIKKGREVNIMFVNGSTYGDSWGQCTGLTGETGNATTNELTRAQAPTLSVCGATAYPITVAGQYAGEGFIGANEVHTFVLVERADGYAWEDLTAKNIYCNKTRNYSKNRDGLIEQFGDLKGSNSCTLPIIFSNISYIIEATPSFSTVTLSGPWYLSVFTGEKTVNSFKEKMCSQNNGTTEFISINHDSIKCNYYCIGI